MAELFRIMMDVQLRIAEIVLIVGSDGVRWAFESDSVYSQFVVRSDMPDVRVLVRSGFPTNLDWGEPLVVGSGSETHENPDLNLNRNDMGEWILEVVTGGRTKTDSILSRRVGVFNQDFSSGQVFLGSIDSDLFSYPFPLRSPLDRALFAHRLPYCDGLLLHAAAVVHQGRAFVFAGQSGRGKSTMAKLWSVSGEGLALGEESIALRRVGSEIRAYGTPWPGESGLASPQGAPVAGLFFLRHGPHNTVRSMGPAEAMAEFLPRSYLAPYDPIGAARGLEFLHHLIATVPMAELAFRPDADVVELLASGRWADGLA